MKEFWYENKKIISSIYLNQFGAAFMGLLITTATTKSDWLMLCASLFSTVFYLMLIYTVIWTRGGQDRIRFDGGRAPYRPLTGLWISLICNLPTILLGICINVGYLLGRKEGFVSYEWAGNMYVITNAISRIWNAMYIGIIQYFSPNNPIIHLLHTLPAIFVTTFGYYIGLRNKRILGIFALKRPENESDTKKK